MKIKEKLKLIQQLSGMSQESLANKFSVSFVTLNSWINGRSIPRRKKQDLIDELYKTYSGEKLISNNQLLAKKNILDKKRKEFKNIIKVITNRQDIFNEFMFQLTHNSNKIEGSTLSQKDTEAILFRNVNLSNKSLIEHLEVKNHQAIINYVFRIINKDLVIDEKLIKRLHGMLMNGIRSDAGMYRTHNVRIVASHVPTANYLKISSLMKNLVISINKSDFNLIHNIAKIHSEFERIHPFSDGNGRIGRIIIIIMLLKNNFAPAIIKEGNKILYYRYLQKAQLEQDYSLLEDFLYDAIIEAYKIIN